MKLEADHIAVIKNRSVSLDERLSALRELRLFATPDVRDALLQVACKADEDPKLLAAVGAALAYITHRGRLEEPSLHDMTGISYLAYDREVAQLRTPDNDS
jgi:hypothetical protein